MSVLRVFIAIEFPTVTQDAIQKQTAHLRQVLGDGLIRWVPTHNLHLTLKFLGDVATTHIEFLRQMLLHEVDPYTEFDIQFGGLGSFPASKSPRVLWLGLHVPAALPSLQHNIESAAAH